MLTSTKPSTTKTNSPAISPESDWKSGEANTDSPVAESLDGAVETARPIVRHGRAFIAKSKSPRIVDESSFLATATRSISTSWYYVIVIALGFFPLAAGCQTPTHAEAQIQAEQRWSQVRGQVKLQLARQQFDRGHFEDAIKTLDEAILLDPASAETYALLVKANLELGKPGTAGQILAKAGMLGCDSAELHYLQGVVLEQRDDLQAAAAEYAKAFAMDPSKSNYLMARIETLVTLDLASDALALVDQHIHQFDDNAALALLGARIAMMQGDLDSALERFQNPSIRDADSQIAAEELGSLLSGKGHHREAIRTLSGLCEAGELCRLSVTGQRILAESHLAIGEPDAALRVLSTPPISEASDGRVRLLVAKAALGAGQYMQALEAIDAARAGRAGDAELDLLLATTHWKRGDFPGAEAVLTEILNSNPADVEAWCLLGEVYNDSGRPEKASEALGRALEIDPESRWASNRIRQIGVNNGPADGGRKKLMKRS